MGKFYSPSTRGFYDTSVHGPQLLKIPDPSWVEGEEMQTQPEIEAANPACKIPEDALAVSDDAYQALFEAQAAGKVLAPGLDGAPVAIDPPAPTRNQLKSSLSSAVQSHLDSQAQSLGYDNIFTAATYADEPSVAKFQAEGRALRAWRSAVWQACGASLAEIESNDSPIPTAQELIESLPAFSL